MGTKNEDKYKYFKLDGPVMIERTKDGQLKISRLDKEKKSPKNIPSISLKGARLLATNLFLQIEDDGTIQSKAEPGAEFGQMIESTNSILADFDCAMHSSSEPPGCTQHTVTVTLDLPK